MITDILRSLGFDTEESKTYLLLLESGPTSAGALSKKTGAVRSSLYGFLKRLIEHGLVTQSLKGAVKTFAAEPPEKVTLLFEQRIEELQKQEQRYRDLIPDLKKFQPTKFIIPKLQFFEGAEGLQNMIRDVFLYSHLETQSFWPIKKMLDILSPDFFRYMNKQRIRNNISLRSIWPASEVVDIKKYPFLGAGKEFMREFRVAPEQVAFSMGYWIYGHKVAFVSSRKENFGFSIDSAEFAEMLLTQFDVIWQVATPLKVNPADTKSFLEELKKY